METHCPVLIVGSGLAGLTSAVNLAWRGVSPLLVERHADTSRNPRARSVNIRSMELLRIAGLESDLVAAGPQSFNDFSIIVAESVTGRELRTVLPRGGAGGAGTAFDMAGVTSAKPSTAGQDRIEPILRRHAQALGAQLRYSTELLSFEQDSRGVTATIRNLLSQREERVRADYLIAADGNRSRIREQLGIGVHGRGSLSHNIGIIFEGNIEALIGERSFALYYLQNPNFTGAFINTDVPGRALVSVEYDPSRQSPEDFDTQRCLEVVRAALGVPQFEARILEVLPWEMASRVADEFSRGRVFLAGDAAHTMPPTGGLGGQTAIQDGYDLAWKLALVLRGDAEPALLETYQTERQPVAELTVELQTANYVERLRPDRTDLTAGAQKSGRAGELDYMGVAMGYRYRSAAIATEIPDDGAPMESPLAPTGRPGTRAAHIPFLHRGARISLLDLIGREFVLLSGTDGTAWARAAATLAFEIGVPLASYRVGSDLLDVDHQWATRLGVTDSGAVLVRPDGFIAWRSQAAQESPTRVLREVLAQTLCRSPDSLRRPDRAAVAA